MKKLPLTLIAIVTLSASIYLLSCKKETGGSQELPAIQKIRDAAMKDWEISEKSLLQVLVTFDQKIKPEYANFETDTSISVTVWAKFKDQAQEVKLPYAVPGLGGTKYYFYSLAGSKPKILFHSTGACDLDAGGAKPALPIESVTIVFEKINLVRG